MPMGLLSEKTYMYMYLEKNPFFGKRPRPALDPGSISKCKMLANSFLWEFFKF
jgi:hypothetical protein